MELKLCVHIRASHEYIGLPGDDAPGICRWQVASCGRAAHGTQAHQTCAGTPNVCSEAAALTAQHSASAPKGQPPPDHNLWASGDT
eukprot:357218-Chlamydomonas_euryale.AAC.27